MKETTFVNKIKSYLKTQGAFPVKIHGHEQQHQGLPDLIICYKGRYLGIEAKLDSNKATELQRLTLMNIIKTGGIGIIVTLHTKHPYSLKGLAKNTVIISIPVSPYKDEIFNSCSVKDFLDGGWLIRYLNERH